MTVSTELSHEEYTGNGVTTDFDFRFRIFEAKHLIVSVADTDGTERILTNGTDYTLRGVGAYRGGKVILKMPLAQSWKIGIARDLPAVQETDLRNQGKFFAEVHEDAFDYLTMLIQKSMGFLSLCLRKPSFIADHYDAKGDKISNLGKPVKDGDAVNLGTMKEHISSKDKRSLRVADKDIPALPGTSVRRNKQLGFDNNGMPLLLDPAETGALGYVLVDSFEKGAVITSRYQALHWLHNGEYYRWDGALPKTVSAGSTPDSAGGIGVGAWIGVGDASSRRWVEQHYGPSFYVRTNASFTKGGEVNSVRDCILNTTDGFYYKYTGAESFPVSVPAGSSPGGDWTCVYSAIDNLETVCFSDAIVAGEMHPLKITTTGYHVGSDIGGNEFVPSGTGTPGDTDHGSFFVTSRGVKYHSTSPVAWATQFGATKDGGSEDVISAAIARMPQWSSFGIDPGIKFNKPITASVVGMTFTGRGIHSELTTFDKGAAFIITSEYITFEKMNIRGIIEIADDNAFILDAREYKRADFDVFVKNCRVGGFRYAVSTKGRGVEISECLFYEMETVLKISVPDIAGFEDGTTEGQKYPNAFRTYYITNNRLHSVYGFVAENMGDNAHVAKGFLITGNISDGLCGGLKGYFKNLDWYGNNFGAVNQVTSARPALFELWSPDCVNISGSFTGYPAGTDASGNSVEQRIYQSIARIHDAKNVKFDVSVAQYAYHGFSVDGSSLSVDINVNGDSPLGNGRSVVKLEDNANVKNLKISGLINNINTQEKVYLSAGNNVTVESMDLSGFMVSNRVANESISDIPPAKHQNIGSQGVSYTGNGAASMNVVLDASPKSVTIFGGSKGIFKAHYQIPALTSNVTFNRRTIAVKGDCNASGQVYYVECN